MNIEEIFTELSSRMIEGLMIHDQMLSYYCFLNLEGYAKCHEYHYWSETISYGNVKKHYFKFHNKLIKEKEIENPNVIPKAWYSYNREDVDISTKRNAVKAGIEKWVDWEEKTKNLYKDLYGQLIDLKEYNDACYVKCLICDVEEELAQAKKEHLNLKDADFNINSIISEQKEIYKKYKNKIKEMEK